MREDSRESRREEIERAAYEVLAERGFAGTSMLLVARRARASNETLYRWYGDKQGLFRALIERNATEVRVLLEGDMEGAADPLETLAALGPRLLDLLLGERAVALARAAAADGSGELGKVLAREGRGQVMPLVERVFARAHALGALDCPDAAEAAALWLALLVGDLQIRRAIGAIGQPAPDETARRAERALAIMLELSGRGRIG
ncbi:MAG: helix-turn-helix domain-containing protein [Geminicoccaceae bacterium]